MDIQDKALTLIGPITQLVNLAGLPDKGPVKDDLLTTIDDAGILCKGNKIKAIDKFATLEKAWRKTKLSISEIEGDHICIPGFVDAHTHICFHGSRARDYALRNAGKSYLDIARAGGGIWDTVKHTRNASMDTLVSGIVERAYRHLKSGITTIEVKSGYGLSIQEELKMLRAIKTADTRLAVDLIPTCLAAHILPHDFNGSQTQYLEVISENVFPVLHLENLTNRIDAFIEKEAFTADIIDPFFERAKQLGFDITVHADQFTAGGSLVAVKFGACSADHLEASTESEIDLLSKSNVTATVLPGASIGLGVSFAPARKLLDAGCAVAIASDWNPGSAPMGDLLTQACIMSTFEKLTNAELLAGLTFRAARALKLYDRGQLVPGFLADFALYPTNHVNEVCYHQGKLLPDMVWKNGQLVYQSKEEKIKINGL